MCWKVIHIFDNSLPFVTVRAFYFRLGCNYKRPKGMPANGLLDFWCHLDALRLICYSLKWLAKSFIWLHLAVKRSIGVWFNEFEMWCVPLHQENRSPHGHKLGTCTLFASKNVRRKASGNSTKSEKNVRMFSDLEWVSMRVHIGWWQSEHRAEGNIIQ